MKLTAPLQLVLTADQHDTLVRTMTRANEACDYISQVAWDNQTFAQFKLHKLVYHVAKDRFGLSAQMVIRCISKVTDAYKLDNETQRTFRASGAIAYDERILTYNLKADTVSLWTLDGRLKNIPFRCGKRQRELLQTQQGESDLCLVRGKFYLNAVCNVEEPEPGDIGGVLGVDLGIVNLATTSDGESFCGKQLEALRQRHQALRLALQAKGTKSAKRHLKKLSGKQARFQKHENHIISKQLVAVAKGTNRALALEDLKGISKLARKEGKRLRKTQRAKHTNWSFHQLRLFITYKAAVAGVPLAVVDPRYTSQRCHCCGHTERANRRSQESFVCQDCGHEANADVNGARNISYLGAMNVNRPIVSLPRATA
jgi:putative transposase